MRSLNLLLGDKSKVSTLQTIWEVWFTISTLTLIIAILIWLVDTHAISIGCLVLLTFHVIMSTLVGIVTSED